MTKKPKPRVKHAPQRTCVGCRLVLPKRTLIRVVRTTDGVRVDPSGKANGRGAYVHNSRDCWLRALKGALAGALRVELSASDRDQLEAFVQTLPEETPSTPEGAA
ncbi:MAG TPA: YlxR family protein [Anaerolineaceae bacterium]|nr:YlxR family protein [Anaerolineaceae bacterium]